MALISHWKLDGDATDSVSGYNGTVTGATYTAIGKIGGCYSFDGSGDYILVPTPLNLNSNLITVSAWVKCGATNTWFGSLFGFGVDATTTQDIYYWGNGNFGFNTWNSDCWGFSNSTVAGGVMDGNWHHLVAIFNRDNITSSSIYVDGIQKTLSQVAGTTLTRTVSNNFGIGLNGWNTPNQLFNGLIDDVRIYNHALSQKEVKELSRAKVLHYDFDDFQEPTTNLETNFTTPIFTSAYNGTGYNFGASTDLQQTALTTLGSGCIVTKVNRIVGGTSQSDYVYRPAIGVSANETKTFSFKYFGTYGSSIRIYGNSAGTTTSYYLNALGNWVVGGTGSVDIPVTANIWQTITIKLVNTGTAGSEAAAWIILHLDNYPATLTNTQYWMFTDWMIEQKDHATPFVNGSRTGQVKDISGYDNHSVALAESTTPQWVAGKLGSGGYYFDGTDRYIKSSISASYLASLKTCSISFWRKHTALASWLPFMGQTTSHYIMATSGGTGAFYHDGVGSNTKTIYVDGVVSTTPSTDLVNWHHYVITGLDLTAWTEFYLGHYPNEWLLEGSFDDIRIYNTNLSVDDVKELYQTRAQIDTAGNFYSIELEEPPVTDGLVGWWKMDGDATDSSGYENDGVVTGATLTTGIRGVANTAYGFDGVDDYIEIPQTISASVWSVSSWVNLTLIEKSFQFFIGENSITGGKILLRKDGYVSFRDANAGTYSNFTLLTNSLCNAWNHLVWISNGTTINLYLNGILNSSITPTITTLNMKVIGNGWGDFSWTTSGVIDDVRIYNKALTQAEITLLYNLGLGIYE